MHRRTLLIASVSTLFGVCLALSLVRSTSAQVFRIQRNGRAESQLLGNRTDLIDDVAEVRAARAAAVDVARIAYEKLRAAAESSKGAISDEVLHGASREWLLAKLRVSKSRPECIEAVSEYLEREGFTVAKTAD